MKLPPVRAVHVMTCDGHTWYGTPAEPGSALQLDVGALDMLTEHGYGEACQRFGCFPDLTITGSGEAVDSLRRCLEQYRQEAVA